MTSKMVSGALSSRVLSRGAALALCGWLGISGGQAQVYEISAMGVTDSSAVRLGLADWPVAAGRAAFGVSNRALDAQWRRSFAVLGVGAATVQVQGAYAGGAQAGMQLGAGLGLSVGPVVLRLSAYGWDTPLAVATPLAPYGLGSGGLGMGLDGSAPLDLSSQGHLLVAQARYRLRRDLILSAFAQHGLQSGVGLAAQWKPAARGELSSSYQVGMQAMQGAAGIVAGVGWEAEDWSLTTQALLRGAESGASVQWRRSGVPVAGHLLDINAYAAYEPWRRGALPLRYGLGVGTQAGRQHWAARLVGGQNAAGRNGYGAALSWNFGPTKPPPEQE